MKSTLQVVKISAIFREFSIQAAKLQRGSMSKKTFFYAVKRGHNPGVYKTWDECLKEVSGFSCASYRKFPTYEAAAVFAQGKNAESTNATTPEAIETLPPLPPGPYSTSLMPSELQPVPIGNCNKKKKKEKNITSPEVKPQRIKNKERTSNLVTTLFNRVEELEREVAQLKGKHKAEPHTTHVPEPPKKQVKLEEFDIPSTMVHVYTDGACTRNGTEQAKAGIGVYWGPEHPLNVSERLSGRQTNNRAEIHAAAKALNQAKSVGIQELTLYTDSIFVINGITKWIKKWKRNGWKLSSGQPVINRTDFEDLEKAEAGLTVKWVHVPGHQGFPGNEAADYLAVQSLSKPLVE